VRPRLYHPEPKVAAATNPLSHIPLLLPSSPTHSEHYDCNMLELSGPPQQLSSGPWRVRFEQLFSSIKQPNIYNLLPQLLSQIRPPDHSFILLLIHHEDVFRLCEGERKKKKNPLRFDPSPFTKIIGQPLTLSPTHSHCKCSKPPFFQGK